MPYRVNNCVYRYKQCLIKLIVVSRYKQCLIKLIVVSVDIMSTDIRQCLIVLIIVLLDINNASHS